MISMVLDDLWIAWAQQGLKDMTSMSGLRQGVPQERQSDSTRLARSGARRIVCASRHPPRPLGGLENWRLGGLEDVRIGRVLMSDRNWKIRMMIDD